MTGHAFLCQMASGGFREYADAFCYDKLKGQEEDPQLRRRIQEDGHADVLRISGATGAVKVDQVRSLIQEVAKKPYEGSRRVVCIEYADAMTAQAQNALLKTLEEPPEGCVMLLLVENKYRMLPTILSRCTILRPAHSRRRGGTGGREEAIIELVSEDDIQHQENLAHLEERDKIYQGMCAGLACMEALQKGKTASGAAELLPQGKEEFDAACLLMLCYFSKAMEVSAGKRAPQGLPELGFWEGKSPAVPARCAQIMGQAMAMTRQNVSMKLVSQWLCINMLEELD